jgi:hypothetical protein
LGVDFKVSVQNNVGFQRHDFKHVAILILKNREVIIEAPLFDPGADFKVFICNFTGI